MKFRDVRKMNLTTLKLFSLQTLYYGTIGPTALELQTLSLPECFHTLVSA